MYTTSMSTIRETYFQCVKLENIFYNKRYRVLMKDIGMDKAYAQEFKDRCPDMTVPQVFARGLHFGDAESIFTMNERDELDTMLTGFASRGMDDCSGCGGSGFVVCGWCSGSRRSEPVSNAFTNGGGTNAQFLKCTVCNENGLERCREC